MARPIAADYDERRAKIRAAAVAIFSEHGYHKASIGQITDAVGISKSLIYHYFASKQEILAEAMRAHVEELLAIAEAAVVGNAASPDEALHQIIRGYLRVYETAGATHKLLLNELGALDPADRAEIRATESRIVHIFADLADAIAPADLGTRHAASVAAMLLMGSVNFSHIWYRKDGPLSSEQLAEIVYRIFSTGFRSLDDSFFSPA